MAIFNVSHPEGLRWQTEWYWQKNTKVIVGKIVQKIEKHDLLPFSFFLNQSGRREPMWMESLRSKALADFCKRHLFKFCTFSTSEGGCLCFGAKNSAACQVLEDVASSDFSSKQELHLLAIKNFFFKSLKLITTNQKVFRPSLWPLVRWKNPYDENAHTEFSFDPKTEFQIKFKLKITFLLLKVRNRVWQAAFIS